MQRSIFSPAAAVDSGSEGVSHDAGVALPARPALPGIGRPISRRLSRAAGFYRQEVDAVLAARRLRARGGLAAAQVSVMQRDDAVHRAARRAVAPKRSVSAAAIGAGGAAALAAVAVLLEPALHGLDGILLLLGMAITGGVLGTAVDVVVGWGPLGFGHRRRRFDRMVDQQLADGAWVVLVHSVGHLPPARQALVLEMLRESSYKWCADAPRQPVVMI